VKGPEHGPLAEVMAWRTAVDERVPAPPGPGIRPIFGDAWVWTRSADEPCTGYRHWGGTLADGRTHPCPATGRQGD
jgi:hypothetical protein